MAKTNVTKATREIGEVGVKVLTEKLKKAKEEKLKKDNADLTTFLKDRGLQIVPAVQLKVDDRLATFEIHDLINGITCYLLRSTE